MRPAAATIFAHTSSSAFKRARVAAGWIEAADLEPPAEEGEEAEVEGEPAEAEAAAAEAEEAPAAEGPEKA